MFYTGKKGGTESYTRSLYTEIGRRHPEIELVGLLNTELRQTPPDWFPGETVPLPVSGENRLAWAAAENTLVPAAALRAEADVLHCPANFGPAVSRVPVALTVHDLLAFRYPELVPNGGARAVQWLTRTSVRGARVLLTDSTASATDIRSCITVGRRPIKVIPLAAPSMAAGAAAPASPGHERPFLFSTGNRLPHKNFPVLLEALARIPAHERPRLVIPGSHGDDPLRALVDRLDLHDDVELLGWVTPEELDRLYRTAALYVLPSRFEGFGLPVLEAMSRGCPVVCSDIPVLREVGGEAAAYLDTRDATAVADTLRTLLKDPAELSRLSTAGQVQASKFSWSRVADETVAALRLTSRH
ncbi:glycosyltransferase family 1 protein [Rhodococcus sp. X156]|uniref:glycosyltransferase family 4 protein n=1 Tax=Rhodococcus sp. X156 TaxID=2499145 RepID=UPI0013E3440B|nr:glycosyltransferase family 1 protein [Rhodococcus sp. X156]